MKEEAHLNYSELDLCYTADTVSPLQTKIPWLLVHEPLRLFVVKVNADSTYWTIQ